MSTKTCVFLSYDGQAGLDDDATLHEPMLDLGWTIETVPWRLVSSHPRMDAAVIRNTWDYQGAPDEFLEALTQIQARGVPLFNGLDIVRWNYSKTYLDDLARRGLPVVPTTFHERLEPGGLATLLDGAGEGDCASRIVVKPVISANAEGTFTLDQSSLEERTPVIEATFADRPFMVQPFARSISTEGEFSLMYFDGAYSHSVLKKPAQSDFRVQESYGGGQRSVESDVDLVAAADEVIGALDQVPVYARVDMVRSNSGDGFWLMELELIEPSLFLRMDVDAPRRFAESIDRRYRAAGPEARNEAS